MKPKQKSIFSDDFLKNEEIDFTEFKFVGKLAGKAWKLEQAVEKIKRAKLTLFILGGLIIIPSLMYLLVGDILLFISSLVIGCVFIIAGIMVKKYPIVSIIIPLVLYLALILLETIEDPFSLYKGLVWKIIFIFLLGYGAYSAIIAKRIKQDLIESAKRVLNQEN